MEKAGELLNDKKVGVIPTDTLYGIVGSALDPKSVERIYKLKNRNRSKPTIILISSYKDLKIFGIKLNKKMKSVLDKIWPGPTSVALPALREDLEYLHRGAKTLAFRFPNSPSLRKLLEISGPIIAPSANLESFPPAETIEQARSYFNEGVDFYVDGGEIRNGTPSTLILLNEEGEMKVLRQGAGIVSKI